jgi:hypothetical protein
VEANNKPFRDLPGKEFERTKLLEAGYDRLKMSKIKSICDWSLPTMICFRHSAYLLIDNLPAFKESSVGILRIPNLAVIRVMINVHFPITTVSGIPVLFSTIGPTIRHGPHHSAQKSITGLSAFRTVSWKFASVISKAILFFFFN